MQIKAKLTLPLVLLVSLVFVVQGCSFIERNTIGLFSSERPKTFAEKNAQHPIKTSAGHVSIEPMATPVPTESPYSKVELIWAVPPQSVEAFVIYYGTDAATLDQQVKVVVTDLDKYEDPEKGQVFRYVLDNLPKKQSVFFSVAPVSGETVSERSPVVEVTP